MNETQTQQTTQTDDEIQEELGDGTDEGKSPDEAKASAGVREPDSRDSGPSRRARRRERATDKAKRISDERLDQARSMAEDLRHKRDCPEEGTLPGEDGSRVEHFPATKPRSLDLPEEERGKRLLVIRCIECGESEVDDDESKG